MFRMRRSIRNYKDKPVESEIMEDLLRTATYAPSGHNTQPTNWMVFQGASLVRLRGLTLEFLKQFLEKMPEIAIPAHVPEVIEATEAGHDKIFYGAPISAALPCAHRSTDSAFRLCHRPRPF